MTTESNLEQIERLRERTRHNEASALGHAKREGAKEMADAFIKNLRALGATEEFIEKALKGGVQ
jgi:hypothetical protein